MARHNTVAPISDWRADIDRTHLSPSLVARVLAAVALLLILISFGLHLTALLTEHTLLDQLLPVFSANAEKNVPAYFSTFLLLFAAVLLAIIAVRERVQSGAPALYWAALSFGFLLMTIDEALSYHERLVGPFRELLGDSLPSAFYYAWVVPGIALVLVLVLFFARFLMRLPANTRRAFLLAGALYIGGAIGMEMVGGYYVASGGAQDLTYYLITTAEEALEMAGAIVFIWALLTYIAKDQREATSQQVRDV